MPVPNSCLNNCDEARVSDYDTLVPIPVEDNDGFGLQQSGRNLVVYHVIPEIFRRQFPSSLTKRRKAVCTASVFFFVVYLLFLYDHTVT